MVYIVTVPIRVASCTTTHRTPIVSQIQHIQKLVRRSTEHQQSSRWSRHRREINQTIQSHDQQIPTKLTLNLLESIITRTRKISPSNRPPYLYTTNSCRNNRAENQQSKVPLSSEQEKLYKRGRWCQQTISTDVRRRQVRSGISGAEKNQKDLT